MEDDRKREGGDAKERGGCELYKVCISKRLSERGMLAYPNERPRRRPIIMRQVPYEIAHDPSDYQATEQLEESHGMEYWSRVMGRRGFRAAVKRVEHRVVLSPVASRTIRGLVECVDKGMVSREVENDVNESVFETQSLELGPSPSNLHAIGRTEVAGS